MTTCSIDGCEREAKTRGWCLTHYKRWHRHGDPLITAFIKGDDIGRFWSYVRVIPDCCFEWEGHLDDCGYGLFQLDGRSRRAHQVALEWAGIEIPNGMETDHLCRNRACINVMHLEVVTHQENCQRSPLIGRHPHSRLGKRRTA